MPEDAVPASRKLGRDDAVALASQVKTLIVAKGKKVSSFQIKGEPDAQAIDAMLGPTGNLRAPTLRSGTTLLVGFNDGQYRDALL